MYEMGQGRFLFEFPSKIDVEQVMRGDWRWKSYKVNLRFWSSTVGAIPYHVRVEQVWIRLVGLPIQLWSQEIFKNIGDYCGGWIQTEEETELRNHLKWARVLIRGDGEDVPKSVKVDFKG